MNVRRIGSMPLASMVGICLLAALKTAAMGQAPNAKPAPTAQDVLPVYIEEFFLSEAVRSEEHGELQLTVNGMASLGRGSAADGKSAGLDIEYGVTRRLQFGSIGIRSYTHIREGDAGGDKILIERVPVTAGGTGEVINTNRNGIAHGHNG